VRARATAGDRWVRRFRPAPDATHRLVCLPHAGGAAGTFQPWSRALSPRVDVLAVQYPGRQDRHGEPLVGSVRELADGGVPALEPWTDRPYSLFGHSMGASVAFEAARALEAREAGPAVLVLSGRRAPPPEPAAATGRRHLLDDDALKREIEQLGATMPDVLADPELAQLVLRVVRSDYRAAETYWAPPEAVVRCPVVCLVGSDDPLVSPEQARNWRRHTSGAFELHVLPGDHFFLDRHREAILGRIVEHLGAPPAEGAWAS
jgi:pyochelin biosynthetic protein PchC